MKVSKSKRLYRRHGKADREISPILMSYIYLALAVLAVLAIALIRR